MTHRRTLSFNDHFDDCFIVFETYNKASWREDWTFWGNGINVFQYIDLPLKFMMFVNIIIRLLDLSETWETFPKTETIRSHFSRAGKPSNLNPVAKKMNSDSVELSETEVCFLHTQLIGTNVWLPKMHNVPPEVDFEFSRSPSISESWKSQSALFAVLPTWQYCLYSQVWWMCEINRFRRFSLALVHVVIDRAIFHFRTIWEHTCDKSPTFFPL